MRNGTGKGALLAGAMVLLGAVAGVGGAAAQSGDFAYVGTNLFGENEVGHEGAGKDATGNFSSEIDLKRGRICYLLEVEGLDEVVAAHIHEGNKTENGPPVMTLQLAGPRGDDICVEADKELLMRIARRPENHYVNVHTTAFPEGAVRGQLGE
ncbi:MAG: CHRD domain-containing protein [Erythrobacter sp.]